MKSNHTKLFYSTLISTFIFLSTVSYTLGAASASQKPEEEIIAELITCISNVNDNRTYVQFIDSMIEKVNHYKEYLVEYFKQNHPHLSVDGFLVSLQTARKATHALSAGAALKNYYQLLPKDVTYMALMTGINRRMQLK